MTNAVVNGIQGRPLIRAVHMMIEEQQAPYNAEPAVRSLAG
jgi:hypothetical protein